MEHTREYIEAQRREIWPELYDQDFPHAYEVIHQVLSRGTGSQRASKRTPKRECNADLGINTQRK